MRSSENRVVKGYWRVTKRRHKRKTPKTPEHYYSVDNGLGRSCGHHHRTFSGALKCRKRMDRAQRMAKARYGKSASPGIWNVDVSKARSRKAR